MPFSFSFTTTNRAAASAFFFAAAAAAAAFSGLYCGITGTLFLYCTSPPAPKLTDSPGSVASLRASSTRFLRTACSTAKESICTNLPVLRSYEAMSRSSSNPRASSAFLYLSCNLPGIYSIPCGPNFIPASAILLDAMICPLSVTEIFGYLAFTADKCEGKSGSNTFNSWMAILYAGSSRSCAKALSRFRRASVSAIARLSFAIH